MYAKSFLALNPAGRLTGVRTALRTPSDVYTCHRCGSSLVLHAETERPWFAHTDAALTVQGQQFCPYIHLSVDETRFIRELQRYVPNAKPVIRHAGQCASEYAYHVDGEAVCS